MRGRWPDSSNRGPRSQGRKSRGWCEFDCIWRKSKTIKAFWIFLNFSFAMRNMHKVCQNPIASITFKNFSKIFEPQYLTSNHLKCLPPSLRHQHVFNLHIFIISLFYNFSFFFLFPTLYKKGSTSHCNFKPKWSGVELGRIFVRGSRPDSQQIHLLA